jgi:hypothetical protein
MQRTREFALGDAERAQRDVEFLGYLLGVQRPVWSDEAACASQGDHGAAGPRLGPAVTHNAQPGGVGEHSPDRLGVVASEAPAAVGGG